MILRGGYYLKRPILQEVGALFIPVSDIEKARDWYCDILGIQTEGDIQFGHIFVLPMKGCNIVLDSKIFNKEHTYKIPAFHLNTENIEEAYEYLKNKHVHILSEIQHGHFFLIQDPDNNTLMVSKC